MKISKIGAILRSYFWPMKLTILNKDLIVWLDGARSLHKYVTAKSDSMVYWSRFVREYDQYTLWIR
jgi:hypothetical protein